MADTGVAVEVIGDRTRFCALARAGTSAEASPLINNPAPSSRAARGAQSSELTVSDTLSHRRSFRTVRRDQHHAECTHPRDALAVSRSSSAVLAPSKPCRTTSCFIVRRVRIESLNSHRPIQPQHFTLARRVSGALGGRNSPRVPSRYFTHIDWRGPPIRANTLIRGDVGQSRRWHMTASDQFSSRKTTHASWKPIHT